MKLFLWIECFNYHSVLQYFGNLFTHMESEKWLLRFYFKGRSRPLFVTAWTAGLLLLLFDNTLLKETIYETFVTILKVTR